MAQTVTVVITGANDAPTITTTTSTDLVGAVTEDTSVVSSKLSDTGVVTFTDVDLTDAHTVTAVASSSNTLGGTLTMGTVSESSTTAAGSVGWTYSVTNSAAQYLASGQTATETFTVTVSDSYGGSVAQTVTVVITGTNDTPVATYTTSNTVAEDASITGQLTSTDVDTADTETYRLVSTSSTGSIASDGNVNMTINSDGSWTFDASAYDELSASESQYITVNYKVTDSSGGYATNSFVVTVTGVNDVPTLIDPAPEFQQGAASGYTIATLSEYASDLDQVNTLTYSISSAYGTNSTYTDDNNTPVDNTDDSDVNDWFSIDSSTGALKILSPLVEDAAVNGNTSYTVYVRCTDDQGTYVTTAINLSVDLADSTATASLPYDFSSWSFAPSSVGTGYGFILTSTSDSNLYVNLANSSITDASVTKELSFVHIDESSTSYGSVTLANDGTTGIISDSSTAGHDIAITSDTTENVLINVKAVSEQSITGATDSAYSAEFGTTSTNYRDDTLQITDALFSASSFSISGDNLMVTMATGGVKTVTEVEAVKFSDGTTVRVVGADGYSSFLEAINLQSVTADGVTTISALGATSYAADGDYIYYGATDTFYSYVDDTASTGNTISVSSTTTVDKFIKVLDASTQTITGVSDTSTTLGTNYRDDTVLISDAAFTDAKFSMSGTSLKITTDNSVKTLSEVESVMFNDGTTVRVVGASGYASFLEAINQGNTSHAAVNDYVYGSSSSGYTPTAADLTHLTAVSGHTDFYTYNG